MIVRASVLTCVCVVLFVASLRAQATQTPTPWFEEPGGLIHLQDRVGDPALAGVIEESLRSALGQRFELAPAHVVRDAQRRLRIRDTSRATSEQLARLSDEAGVGWLFSATLHQVSSGRASRATLAFTGATTGGTPQIAMSALLVRIGRDGRGAELGWAGFEAASGWDRRRLLGLGMIDDSRALGRQVAAELVADLVRRELEVSPRRRRNKGVAAARHGFLREPIELGQVARVAVIPFLGLTDDDATRHGETATAIALATLDTLGVELVLPGSVGQIARRREAPLLGAVDPVVRAELSSDFGAELILTGTVESWNVRRTGDGPQPSVALAARIVDAANGRILWWNGQDLDGWDNAGPLGGARVYSVGSLARRILESLLAECCRLSAST